MLTPGIVHLGCGAFFRAHLALYTDEAIKQSGDNRWGIIAASLFHGEELAKWFQEQNRQYHVLEIAPDGNSQCKTVDALLDILPARDNRLPLIDCMSREAIKIVSLTITEKGYCLHSATGELQLDHPLIEHDFAHPEHPKSAIGIIAAALKQRHHQNLQPFTILSCDNIPDNGQRLRKALTDFLEKTTPELLPWFESQVKTPCSMVDRIVPAVTTEALQQVQEVSGTSDPCAVVTEPFRQWIIEDQLDDCPGWQYLPGVRLVKDVKPYETMKLRMLNGSHSLIAYLGTLAGYETVADAVKNTDMAKFLRHYMLEEAAPTLPEVEIDLNEYAGELLQRFANESLQHNTLQIATDGSQKIPQRWLQGLEQLLHQQQPFHCINTGIAAWFHFLGGISNNGQHYEIKDPLAKELTDRVRRNTTSQSQLVSAMLRDQRIFQPALAKNRALHSELTNSLTTLSQSTIDHLLHAFSANPTVPGKPV